MRTRTKVLDMVLALLVGFALVGIPTVSSQEQAKEPVQEEAAAEEPAAEEPAEEGKLAQGVNNWVPSDTFKAWLGQAGVVGFALDHKPDGVEGQRWCALYIRYLDGKERCIRN